MPDPHHIDAADDPRLAALMAWRQQLIDSGAVSRNAFKEAHLRLVLRSGRTDVAQIRAMLPGSVAEHAEDMAPAPGDSAHGSAGRARGTPRPWLDGGRSWNPKAARANRAVPQAGTGPWPRKH